MLDASPPPSPLFCDLLDQFQKGLITDAPLFLAASEMEHESLPAAIDLSIYFNMDALAAHCIHCYAGYLPEICFSAARYNRPLALSALLRYGASVHLRDPSGRTLLHHAAHSGALLTGSLLLQNGALVTAQSKARKTPLQEVLSVGSASRSIFPHFNQMADLLRATQALEIEKKSLHFVCQKPLKKSPRSFL